MSEDARYGVAVNSDVGAGMVEEGALIVSEAIVALNG